MRVSVKFNAANYPLIFSVQSYNTTMEVSIFSEKEVKSSLSKKSPLPKKSLRKVMQSPYETFWPLVTKTADIEELLRSLLPHCKRISWRFTWSDYKGMTLEERLKVKKSQKSKDESKCLRSQILCGMNELMHGIEDHSIASALVCEDLQPKFLMNAILDLAVIHHVPIIIFPNLRILTEETLGFSCSCLGVKNEAAKDDNSHFSPMHRKIVEVAKEFDLPENIAMFQCPRKEASDMEHQSVHHMDLSWPCLQQHRRSDCETHKKHLRKRNQQEKSRNVGNKAQGIESSSSARDESSQVKRGGEDGGKALRGGVPTSEGLEHHFHVKGNYAHPYLRTFANGHHQRFLLHKQRRSKKIESCNTVQYENVNVAQKANANTKSQRTKKRKSQVCRILQPEEKEREYITLHCYKSLKLVDT